MIAYTAFILDDEPDGVTRLQYLLKKYTQVRVTGCETNPVMAIPQIRSNRPDILFLDIEMPGYSGFEILDKVKQESYSPIVVFVTGYDKYAIKAIRESAFDYLLKPVDRTELDDLIDKLIRINPLQSGSIPAMLHLLTPRECEIFEFIRKGHTSLDISKVLNISPNTVDTHRRRILRKLEISSTREIILRFPISNH